MKFALSTKNVATASFLELCNKTLDYGFSGFEIYDINAEAAQHSDSIFKSLDAATAKRKLINRWMRIVSSF